MDAPTEWRRCFAPQEQERRERETSSAAAPWQQTESQMLKKCRTHQRRPTRASF